MKKALITGITGQDGSYLAEFLLEKGYEVHGLVRRSSSLNTKRIEHLLPGTDGSSHVIVHNGDLGDPSGLATLVSKIRPDEIYNLGAMSHVQVSFESSVYASDVNSLGTLRLLEAIRLAGLEKQTRFYQASTSELYGKVQEVPQRETTPFYPRSPYGVSKLFGYWITVNYREAYGIYACNGILFNHESPRRGETFVTRKITRAVAALKHGSKNILTLGNLDAKRDWGYAKEYVEGMWMMLQQDTPEDYVLATGKTVLVREFVEMAFKVIGIHIEWCGVRGSIDEFGVDARTGEKLVRIDPSYYRPTEVDLLVGDASKAKSLLGWESKTTIQELVELMVKSDVEEYQKRVKGP